MMRKSNCRIRRTVIIYSIAFAVYLSYLGIKGQWVGPLLWLAVVAHAVLTLLLEREWCNVKQPALTGTRDR
jgi:hypothetical protein